MREDFPDKPDHPDAEVMLKHAANWAGDPGEIFSAVGADFDSAFYVAATRTKQAMERSASLHGRVSTDATAERIAAWLDGMLVGLSFMREQMTPTLTLDIDGSRRQEPGDRE